MDYVRRTVDYTSRKEQILPSSRTKLLKLIDVVFLAPLEQLFI